jgi:hypothetical protein
MKQMLEEDDDHAAAAGAAAGAAVLLLLLLLMILISYARSCRTSVSLTLGGLLICVSQTMAVPPAFQTLAKSRGTGSTGAVPESTTVIFSIGGAAYRYCQ